MTKSTATAGASLPGSRASIILEVALGDVVRLRKAHPCGSFDWVVVRLGADIGLRCSGCGRRILLERSVLERRIKQISGSQPIEAEPDLAPERFLAPP